MKILVNFLMVALGVLFLTGCGGGGGNADFLPYIESDDFYKSFTTVNADKINGKGKGFFYYPVSENAYEDFVKELEDDGGYEKNVYIDEVCYRGYSDTASSCSDNATGKRWISIWLDYMQDNFTDEDVIGFFPSINNDTLSLRALSLYFDSDQSSALLNHYKTLKSQGFKDYYDYVDVNETCLIKDGGEIVYSFCFSNDYYLEAEWVILKKALFDALS